MDETDSFIVEELKKDARTSFRKIARKLGVSPDTVINRYENLRAEGVIRGSTVVIDPKKIGYLTYISNIYKNAYNLKNINILGNKIKECKMKFKLHSNIKEQLKW